MVLTPNSWNDPAMWFLGGMLVFCLGASLWWTAQMYLSSATDDDQDPIDERLEEWAKALNRNDRRQP